MAKPTQTTKKRKKLWYQIVAPKIMNNEFLGETNVYDKDQIPGKTLRLNLSTVTNNMKKQSMNVSFQVLTVVDNKAITTITGTALTNAFLKRLVRRGRDKVDDSFTVKTKDQKVVRIKPFITTMNRTSKAVNSKIRLAARKILAVQLKNKGYEEFFNDIINLRLQKEIKESLSKIYPIKSFDIRKSQLLKDGSAVTVNATGLTIEPIKTKKQKDKEEMQEDIDENDNKVKKAEESEEDSEKSEEKEDSTEEDTKEKETAKEEKPSEPKAEPKKEKKVEESETPVEEVAKEKKEEPKKE